MKEVPEEKCSGFSSSGRLLIAVVIRAASRDFRSEVLQYRDTRYRGGAPERFFDYWPELRLSFLSERAGRTESMKRRRRARYIVERPGFKSFFPLDTHGFFFTLSLKRVYIYIDLYDCWPRVFCYAFICRGCRTIVRRFAPSSQQLWLFPRFSGGPTSQKTDFRSVSVSGRVCATDVQYRAPSDRSAASPREI